MVITWESYRAGERSRLRGLGKAQLIFRGTRGEGLGLHNHLSGFLVQAVLTTSCLPETFHFHPLLHGLPDQKEKTRPSDVVINNGRDQKLFVFARASFGVQEPTRRCRGTWQCGRRRSRCPHYSVALAGSRARPCGMDNGGQLQVPQLWKPERS